MEFEESKFLFISVVVQSLIVSDSLRPHGLQYIRLLCPPLSPRICWDSCPLSSATLVSFCLQSFPASMSFPVSWLFVSGGQNIEASASASVFPMNVQGWFPLGLTGLISLQDSQESSLAPQFRGINSSVLCLLHGPTLTSVNDYWKNHSSDSLDLCQQGLS